MTSLFNFSYDDKNIVGKVTKERTKKLLFLIFIILKYLKDTLHIMIKASTYFKLLTYYT